MLSWIIGCSGFYLNSIIRNCRIYVSLTKPTKEPLWFGVPYILIEFEMVRLMVDQFSYLSMHSHNFCLTLMAKLDASLSSQTRSGWNGHLFFFRFQLQFIIGDFSLRRSYGSVWIIEVQTSQQTFTHSPATQPTTQSLNKPINHTADHSTTQQPLNQTTNHSTTQHTNHSIT